MSQWTHVAGMVRVDAMRGMLPLGTPGNPDLAALLGPMCLFDDWNAASTMPRGSEGSLQYAIAEGPGSSLAAYTVSIWGDLRSYDNAEAIRAWLDRTFDGLMIRNGVVMVDVEGRETQIILYSDAGWQMSALATAAPQIA